jgi:thioredoxin-related protein
MKKYLFFSIAFLSLGGVLFSAFSAEKVQEPNATQVSWVGLEEAAQLAKSNPKPILIDVYTDWCKWCRVMDETTYLDADMIKYINTNFYAVKLNAEHKKDIQFQGRNYKYVPNGRKGIHEAAIALLGNRPSYPSTILMDENLQEKVVLKGYQKKEQFLPKLRDFVEDQIASR